MWHSQCLVGLEQGFQTPKLHSVSYNPETYMSRDRSTCAGVTSATGAGGGGGDVGGRGQGLGTGLDRARPESSPRARASIQIHGDQSSRDLASCTAQIS